MTAEQAHSQARKSSRGASVTFAAAATVGPRSGSAPVVVYPVTYTSVSALPPPSVPPLSSLPLPPVPSHSIPSLSSHSTCASAGSLPPTKHRTTPTSGPSAPPKPAYKRPTMTVSIPSPLTPDLEKGPLDLPLTPPSSAGLDDEHLSMPIPPGVARTYSISKTSSRMRTDTRSTAQTLDLKSITSTGFSDVSLASPITPVPVAASGGDGNGSGAAKAVPGVTTVTMVYSDQTLEANESRRAKRMSRANWTSRKHIASQRFSGRHKVLGLPQKIFYIGLGMTLLAVALGIIGVVISLQHERVYPSEYYQLPNATSSES